MKHAILGAGAIGGLVGTALASFGEEVTVVVRPEKLTSYPANLTLERPPGSNSITAPAKAASSLTEPVDVLWIATKTYQLESALKSVQTTPSCVIPLLNGVDHVAVLRARFGNERVVPGTIAVEAERTAPGRFIQRSPFVRQPRQQRRGTPGPNCRTVHRSRFRLPIHRQRANSALEQALLPRADGTGDVRLGQKCRRRSCGRRLETKAKFCPG